jgi:hypothetical protein
MIARGWPAEIWSREVADSFSGVVSMTFGDSGPATSRFTATE